MKFSYVVLNFLAPNELVQIQSVREHGDRQSIGLGDTVNVIGRDQPAGPRHVLHDHLRIAG